MKWVIKMNQGIYLERLGEKFEEIRRLFGWRQEDAGIRMGISRSKVVSIENEPAKLTVSDAQSLFIACDYELFKAYKTLEGIMDKRNKSIISSLISSSIFLTSPLFASSIISLVATVNPKSFTKFIPVLSGVFGSIWATASARLKKEKQIEEMISDFIDIKTLEKSMKATIDDIEKNLRQIFLLEEWDRHLFYEKIHPELKLPLLQSDSKQ
jgi:DNA-binding XRE family transcriptional regulator